MIIDLGTNESAKYEHAVLDLHKATRDLESALEARNGKWKGFYDEKLISYHQVNIFS